MNKQEISQLVQYNFWANGRILTACSQLSNEQFTRVLEADPGWGSLRGILVHTLDTEYGWRTVLQQLDDVILDEADFPDVATLKARWQSEEAAWLDYVNGLNDESLNQGYGSDPDTSPTVWQTIMHVVMHGIQHRSEAAWILTENGRSPGELDFGQFLKEEAT